MLKVSNRVRFSVERNSEFGKHWKIKGILIRVYSGKRKKGKRYSKKNWTNRRNKNSYDTKCAASRGDRISTSKEKRNQVPKMLQIYENVRHHVQKYLNVLFVRQI